MDFINHSKTFTVDTLRVVAKEGLVTLACIIDVEEETVGVREVTTGALLEEAVTVRTVSVLSRLETKFVYPTSHRLVNIQFQLVQYIFLFH